MCYSQGCLRALVHSILMDGSASAEEMKTLLDATAAENVAKAVGLTGADFDPEWDKWLTEGEKCNLRGWDFGTEEQ